MEVCNDEIGVLGAGTMGSGIAYAFAQAGYDVVLRTRKQTTLDKAMAYMKKTLDKQVAKGKMEQAKADEIYARVTPATELEAVADADFILETIAEDLKIKEEIFAELDKICKPGIIFGTNTSSSRSLRSPMGWSIRSSACTSSIRPRHERSLSHCR